MSLVSSDDVRLRSGAAQSMRTLSCHSEKKFISVCVEALESCCLELQSASPYAKVVLGLSGGKTPSAIYETLGKQARHENTSGPPSLAGSFRSPSFLAPLSRSLSAHVRREKISGGLLRVDWKRVVLFLVDERYVHPTHADSNQRLIRETLLKMATDSEGEPLIPESNLIFPDTTLPIKDCVEKYKQDLLQMAQSSGGPDIVTLGVGEDGHLASWFPPLDEATLNLSMDPTTLVAHTTTDKFAVKDRITVSLAFLRSAKHKICFLKGQQKVDLWRAIVHEWNRQTHTTERLLPSDVSFPPVPLPSCASADSVSVVLDSGGVTVVSYPPLEKDILTSQPSWCETAHLTVIVLGASGDLAKKKTFPALFGLFCEGLLPCSFHIVGYARSRLDFETFWDDVAPHLGFLDSFFTKHRSLPVSCAVPDLMEEFKTRCFYVSGAYDSPDAFVNLDAVVSKYELNSQKSNRLMYLALPPSVFSEATRHLRKLCWSKQGWNRVVVEKPFGHDSLSSQKLSDELMSVLTEDETYRIDHYLGKEMVQTLVTVRFANLAFMPLFDRQYVECVRITFKEDIGTQGRGGYFDRYGIIRDIMQNHMLQMLTIIAMERPASLSDDDIRDEKVKVLKQIPSIKIEDSVLGQYGKSEDGSVPGYLEDDGVATHSRCPTFATCVLWVNSERWSGVPFIMKAGKGLNTRGTEVRIQLRSVPGSIYGSTAPNELVVIIQPRMAIYLKMNTKAPGLSSGVQQTELDLSVMDRFDIDRLPDAYERLLLDVIRGDKQNFVRTDELSAAWKIFSPFLHSLDSLKTQPIVYPFGSEGPKEAYELIRKYYKVSSGYTWKNSNSARPDTSTPK